jgi:hypothetical protein
VRDVEKARDKFLQTGLGRLAVSPEVEEILRGPLLIAKGALFAAEQRLGTKLADLLSIFQGELTIALVGFLEPRAPQAQRSPDVLFAFQPRTRGENCLEYAQRFTEQLRAQAGDQLRIEQSQFAGADIIRLSLPGAPVDLSYTLCDGVFLAALNTGRLERVLAARKTAQEGPREPGQATVLGAQPLFQRALGKVGADPDMLVFANLEELRKLPEFARPRRLAAGEAELERLGLENINAVAYGLRFDGSAWQETVFADVPAQARKGLLTLLDAPPVSPEAFALAPQNAVLALAWQTAPQELLNRLLELASEGDPNKREQFELILSAVSQDLQLDVRKDLLGALNGQAVLAVSFPAHNPKVGLSFPHPILKLGVKDRPTLLKALISFRSAARDKLLFLDVVHGDHTLTTAREANPEPGRDPGQFCWTLAGDELLLSLFPLALKEELARVAAAKTSAGAEVGSLLTDPDFRAARGQLAPNPQLAMYLDTRALASAAYDLFVPIAQLNPRFRPRNLDLGLLPSSDLLRRTLCSTAVGLYSEPEGLRLQAYSNGIFSMLLPALGAAQAAKGQQLGRIAALAEGPEAVARRQLLRDVQTQLLAYAQDHQGDYPARLDDLAPDYSKADPAMLGQVTYVGRQAAPNRVVAYVPPGKPGGATAVVLQDGRIRMVPAAALEEVLKEGFTEAPTKAQSVEPPRLPQPDF